MGEIFTGYDKTTENEINLDAATLPKAFYNLSLGIHPNPTGPDSFISRTIRVPVGGDTLVYVFNATGEAGTLTYTPATGSPLVTPFSLYTSTFGPYGCDFIIDAPGLNPRYINFRVGLDSTTTTLINGRQRSDYFDPFFGWQPFTAGSVSISR